MSQENVEIVRGIINAHEPGDFDAVFARIRPRDRMAPLAGVRPRLRLRSRLSRARGRPSLLAAVVPGLAKGRLRIEEFIDAGDSVVTILTQRVRQGTQQAGVGFRTPAKHQRLVQPDLGVYMTEGGELNERTLPATLDRRLPRGNRHPYPRGLESSQDGDGKQFSGRGVSAARLARSPPHDSA
jgi:hypothetical protein